MPRDAAHDVWSRSFEVVYGVPVAIAYARSQGAPAIEGYPVDNRGAKVASTMAYVGTRALFGTAGFRHVADTSSVVSGFPRVLMQLELR